MADLKRTLDWPPKPGDLWSDRSGGLWFAYEAAFSEPQFGDLTRSYKSLPVRLVDYQGNRLDPDEAADWHGPFTRVHREQQTSSPAMKHYDWWLLATCIALVQSIEFGVRAVAIPIVLVAVYAGGMWLVGRWDR